MNHCILPPLLGNLFTLINQHRNSFGGPLGFASQEQQLSNFFLLPVIKEKKEKENGPLGTYLFCSLYEEDMQADSGLKLFGLEHFDFFVHWG